MYSAHEQLILDIARCVMYTQDIEANFYTSVFHSAFRRSVLEAIWALCRARNGIVSWERLTSLMNFSRSSCVDACSSTGERIELLKANWCQNWQLFQAALQTEEQKMNCTWLWLNYSNLISLIDSWEKWSRNLYAKFHSLFSTIFLNC